MRPVIAITKPDQKGAWAFAAVAAAIRIAGGKPIAMTPEARQHHPRISGVVFGGGDDIFPMLYDDAPKQGRIYDRARDAMELELAAQAQQDDIPALGICRGAQLMNVVRGGALYADVGAEYENAAYPNGLWDKMFFRKCIYVVPGSQMHKIIGGKTLDVNSLHKQAVKRLGIGLRATAKESNGIVQAIEDDSLTFFLGLQFHPELLIYKPKIRSLFRHFVKTAARRDPVEITQQ